MNQTQHDSIVFVLIEEIPSALISFLLKRVSYILYPMGIIISVTYPMSSHLLSHQHPCALSYPDNASASCIASECVIQLNHGFD
jgi:hypothetical protein